MATQEEFAGRLMGAFNDGALCLMISVGHRTGLFDTMAAMPPATCAEIAATAELKERYVREWLGAMVTSGVVEIDGETNRYHLPQGHAACLTRGPENMAGLAQYIAELGSVESLIVDCFRNGGGVPYEKYPRFHEIMAEDSAQFVGAALEPLILPLVDGLVQRLQTGIHVLDVGCGRGLTMTRLAELYPNSHFKGLDFSRETIDFAQADASAKGLSNLTFQAADAALPFGENEFDWITSFDAIHDQGQPLEVLRNIHRALKPEGVYLMQEIRSSSHHHGDIGHPLGTVLYTVSCMHCMTVSLAQGGEGLGAMWGEETTRAYLQRAGFQSIEKRELPHDIQNNWYIVRK
ncbi:MAG: class I SAM-dependent methyltransferase [Acidobacteriota bacterium]